MMSLFSLLVVLCGLYFNVNNGALPSPLVGTYFPNWAQYRPSPATFTPSNLEGAIDKLNVIWYGFAYFCPNSTMIQPYWVTELNLCNDQSAKPFELIYVEPKDPQFYQQIEAFKSRNKDLKVIISIGGWNFPSNFWSGMVSDATSRQTFINSCLSFMNKYGFDGVDLDWEYPDSPQRVDEVKITCQKFDQTVDMGGSPNDGANYQTLVQEMRQAFGSKFITVASQADSNKAKIENIKGLAPYIDMFNLMSYDYTVSDITTSTITAPNQPLYSPNTVGVWNDSTSSTIDYYIQAGIPANKMSVGISLYGHAWYVPGLGSSQSDWCKFGLKAQIQGECCGPMQTTYGAKYGQYSQLCGTYMYSEIESAGFDTCFDETSSSNIGYAINPKDGYTAKGVWISYQDKDTINATIEYAKHKGLAGAFSFDISMDTKQFTLQNEIYTLVNA